MIKYLFIKSKNFEINKKQIDDQMSQLNQKWNQANTIESRQDYENQLEKLKAQKSQIIREYASESQEEIKRS